MTLPSEKSDKSAAKHPVAGQTTLTIGGNGRVVIPKNLREAMGIGEDGKVTARIVDGELRLMSLDTALLGAQAAFAHLKKDGESIVDEFIAERRAMWGEE